LLAPQRGLTAIAKSKPKTEKTMNGRLPELSNFVSPPAKPGVYLEEIRVVWGFIFAPFLRIV